MTTETLPPAPARAPNSPNNGNTSSNKLLLAAAAGAGVVALWANIRGREYARSGEMPSLINWERARSLALAMNRAEDTKSYPDSVLLEYRGLVARCEPLIADYMNVHLPQPMDQVFVFNRADWIEANLRAFADLFAPLETLNTVRGLKSPTAVALVGGLNQTVLSAEIGVLLGYLARRVLGQYDLALLGKEPVSGGKLYFVEPNIEAAAETMGLDGHDFRLWLALHETTHAFEFEAFPWVRPHFNTLLERYITLVTQDLRNLQGGLRAFMERIQSRRGAGNGSLIDMVMTPEQKTLFDEMQALMSVVEGYSNHVMNAVGKEVLSSLDKMQRAFESRQRQRTPAEQLFIRLTGLEMKMEQYRVGEQFIDAVVRERDHDFALRVWSGPESLPTLAELRQPKQWIARVERVGELAAPRGV